MKTLKTLGIIGAVLTLFGGTFKMQHWPGAAVMMIIGIALLIVFLFYWFTNSIKSMTNTKEKTSHIILFIVLLLAAIAAIFKIQHWPFGGIMIMIYVALLILVFIPVYLIYLSSEQDENKKNSRLSFFIIYVALSGLFLARGGSSADILNAFAYPDQSIMALSEKIASNNNVMYKLAATDTAISNRIHKVKELSDNMVQYIDQLKIYLLKATEPEFKTMSDADVCLHNLKSKDNYDIPTFILIGEDVLKPRQDANSATELKNKIISYRKELLNTMGGGGGNIIGANQEVFGTFGDLIWLKTEPVTGEGATESWEVGNFYHVPITAVIMTLDQLQNEVRYSESVVLTYMLM